MSPQCQNCGSTDAAYGGVQWFPLVVLHTQFDDDCLLKDHERPELGGLHTFTCADCHTTYLHPENPTNSP